MSEFVLKSENQSPLAKAFREAIGAAPDEEVQITTPTFDRPGTLDPAMIPPTQEDASAWAMFHALKRDDLRAWGCLPFALFTTKAPLVGCRHVDARWFAIEDGDEDGATHELWLFPWEWYRDIPRGFPIVDINGVPETFEPGKTDDDKRFGCLAYGVMIPRAAKVSGRA